MRCAFRRSAVLTELATAPLNRCLIFASSSMKKFAVEPEPTPIHALSTTCLIASRATACLSSSWVMSACRCAWGAYRSSVNIPGISTGRRRRRDGCLELPTRPDMMIHRYKRQVAAVGIPVERLIGVRIARLGACSVEKSLNLVGRKLCQPHFQLRPNQMNIRGEVEDTRHKVRIGGNADPSKHLPDRIVYPPNARAPHVGLDLQL